MITATTPLGVADELLADLVASMTDPPALQWAQLGMPVVTCEALALGVTNSNARELFPGSGQRCGVIQTVTVTVVLGRECVIEYADDGTTDPTRARSAWEQMDQDSEELWEWAIGLDPIPDGLAATTVGIATAWSAEGGLGYIVMTFTTTV